jgi:hypothetical protein
MESTISMAEEDNHNNVEVLSEYNIKGNKIKLKTAGKDCHVST